MPYIQLAAAILFEVVGTAALKTSHGFTQVLPTALVAITYTASFYFLALAIRTIDIGVAYAIWSALGIVLIAGIGAVFFKQVPDFPAVIGLALIIAGVLVIFLWSKTATH